MRKNKGRITLDKIKLTNPQKESVSKLMVAQKNKFKKLLHQAHERIHVIGDHTRNFEFWFNIMGHYEYVSPSCERVSGYTREEFLNGDVTLESIVHDGDKERFQTDKTAAFSGSSGKDVEYRMITKDGGERWVVMSWVPVTTRWGKLIGVRGSIADITELKLYKSLVDTLKIGEKKANENATIAIFNIALDGTIVSWSAAAESLFGYDADTGIGMNFRDLHNDKGQTDALQGKLDQVIQSGSVEYQAWMHNAGGDPLLGYIEMTTLIGADKTTSGILCSIRFIAETA